MKLVFAWSLILAALLLSGWTHGGGGGGASCPFGVSADGCTAGQTETITGLVAGGPPTANSFTFTNATMLTAGRTTYQSYASTGGCSGLTNCHPNWNLAGVDYPVGVRSTYASSLLDPTVSVPSGCQYCPSGSSSGGCTNFAMGYILCASAGTNLTIQGYNFRDTQVGCVGLMVDSGSGTITISDNVFGLRSTCWNNTNNNLVDICQSGATYSTVIVQYNYFDGDGVASFNANSKMSQQGGFIQCNGNSNTRTQEYLYNAFLQAPCNNILSGAAGTNSMVAVLYNYSDGYDYNYNASCHAHMTVIEANQATLGLAASVYNTFRTDASSSGGTALIWYTDGSVDASTYTKAYVDHNLFQVNAFLTPVFTGNINNGTDVITVSGFSGTPTIGATGATPWLIDTSNIGGITVPPIGQVQARTGGTGTGGNGTYNATANGASIPSISADSMVAATLPANNATQAGRNTITNSWITNNFVDCSGLGAINSNSSHPGSAFTFNATMTNAPTTTGNVEMVTGGNINTWFNDGSGDYLSGPAC